MRPRKILYLVLIILSIVYIGVLSLDIMMQETAWNPDLGWFAEPFEYIVRFGGVALIFAFALSFVQGKLGVVCFIVFCVFMILYAILMFLPDSFYSLFAGDSETASQALKTLVALKI